METVRTRAAMQARVATLRDKGARLGLVPTMGALHAGHLALLDTARAGIDFVVASVFVNPTQFGPGEDFERYPRDLEADARMLAGAGCDLLFAPAASDMYASDARTVVEVGSMGDVLCGRSRPGHFRGVTTVVAKLFHLVQPQVAVFGRKDAQQAVILGRMVRDLDWPVELRVVPTVRDPDGLAMSSRNAYLGPEERREALLLHEALGAGRDALQQGERHGPAIAARMRGVLDRGSQLIIDYAAVVDPGTLAPLEAVAGRVLLAVAAFVGRTRLIDNFVLEVQGDGVRDAPLLGWSDGPHAGGTR